MSSSYVKINEDEDDKILITNQVKNPENNNNYQQTKFQKYGKPILISLISIMVTLLLVGIFSSNPSNNDNSSNENNNNDSNPSENPKNSADKVDLTIQPSFMQGTGSPAIKVPYGHFGKIAIVTIAIGNLDKYAKISIQNKREYADKHGYDLFVATSTDTVSPVWEKLASYERIKDDYDWIWLLDLDAYITNKDIRVEDVIQKAKEIHIGGDVDAMFAVDFPWMTINAGSMFVSTSSYMQEVEKEWRTYEHQNIGMAEQGAFAKLWNDDYKNLSSRAVVMEMRYFNAYYGANSRQTWQPGDFTVHFPGLYKKHLQPFVDEHEGIMVSNSDWKNNDKN